MLEQIRTIDFYKEHKLYPIKNPGEIIVVFKVNDHSGYKTEVQYLKELYVNRNLMLKQSEIEFIEATSQNLFNETGKCNMYRFSRDSLKTTRHRLPILGDSTEEAKTKVRRINKELKLRGVPLFVKSSIVNEVRYYCVYENYKNEAYPIISSEDLEGLVGHSILGAYIGAQEYDPYRRSGYFELSKTFSSLARGIYKLN